MERNKETIQIGQKRRKQLDSALSQYKQQKMKKKVSADTQMMTYAAEELEIKRKMMEKMDLLGNEHRQTMSELASSLKTLSDSVSNAFSALNLVLLRQSYHQQPLAPPTVIAPPNYAHHYNMPGGSTFIPSSSPYYCPIPQNPPTPNSSSTSRMSTPLPMPQGPSPASITTYDNVSVLAPVHLDDDNDY